MGYYTQVAGLGSAPSDVTFTGSKGVHAEEQDYSIGGALSTFWRAAENFRTSATFKWATGTGMMWAVSQAAPVRSVIVDNDLVLFEYQPPISAAGEASGGFMANVKVAGKVAPGSQQQWFTRDSTLGSVNAGVWNMVYTGVDGAPATHCGSGGASGPVTSVEFTPRISEKPFIIFESGKYSLQIPRVKTNSKGTDYSGDGTTSVPFEQVYVSDPEDTASVINAKLAEGLHVVLTPGVYQLDKPLKLGHHGQVLLGLGLATLVSAKQNIVIDVGDVDGVRIAGIIVQAGPPGSGNEVAPALIRWGTGGAQGDAENVSARRLCEHQLSY